MIVTEMKTIDGRDFVRTYSDTGFIIERDGARYSEAYDPVGVGRTYTETDELITDDIDMTKIEQKAAYGIRTGMSE
jgi:hypothetical protein